MEEGKVCKLLKALYGLKEAPRLWNECFHDFIISIGFTQSQYDFCLYRKDNVWLLVFVDDILLMGPSSETIQKLKDEFNIKDLGNVHEYLGMEIKREFDRIEISQEKIIKRILEKFGLKDCNGVKTPMVANFDVETDKEIIDVPYRELIGSLLYVSNTSRPDITFATAFLSRFFDKPTEQLWTAGKRVLRYLKETIHKKLTFKKTDRINDMLAYTDSDWAGDKRDRKSTSGAAIFYCNNLISWHSKKQLSVALSSAEAEYLASAVTGAELLYLKGILHDLNVISPKITMFIDNQSAKHMIESFENSKRSKHIDIKAHFIKDIVAKKVLHLSNVSSDKNIADIFTKALPLPKFLEIVIKLHII
jgi:hypothetical protein